MSEDLSKPLSIMLYVLLGVSALFGILFYTELISVDMIIYWCYALFGIGTLSAIVFPLINMAKNPKGAKSAFIGFGALLLIFIISYALADDTMTDKYAKFISGPEASKRVSMGLIAFYILAVIAILTTVLSGFTKLFK